jgi:SAM-dependent methyltransferase
VTAVTEHAVAASWDAEYAAGRYHGEPPEPFTADILAAARSAGLAAGLYVGCGNGRNYLPLIRGGLDLVGLDVSAVALGQLAGRLAGRLAAGQGGERSRLVCGTLSSLTADASFELVVGIQVFQHGDRASTHSDIRRAAGHLRPGGLLCIRVNAVGTDVWPAHEITERGADGGFTVRYLAGSKRGLLIHYFAEAELAALAGGLAPVLPPRLARTWRTPAARGQWSQWEAIWRKPS